MTGLFVYLARCIILILATWLICSFMGKKSLAQFTPYDIAVLFIISNVVSQPLVNKDTVKTAIGIIVLTFSIIIIGRLSLHRFFYGIDDAPSILIADGKLIQKELRKNHINIHILLSMLRLQGYNRIADVNFAILEPGGQVSVIPKSSARPAMTQEMNMSLPEEGLTYAVVIDGKVNKKVLSSANITEEWLLEELKKSFNAKPQDLFYAEVDSNKKIFVNYYKDV